MQYVVNHSMSMKQKFLDEGLTLPQCINPGCSRNVQVRAWSNWSFKTECGTCYKARATGISGKAMEGITIHKKTFINMLRNSRKRKNLPQTNTMIKSLSVR